MTTIADNRWWHPAMPPRLVKAAIANRPGALLRLACACAAIARIRTTVPQPDPDADDLRRIARRLTRLAYPNTSNSKERPQ